MQRRRHRRAGISHDVNGKSSWKCNLSSSVHSRSAVGGFYSHSNFQSSSSGLDYIYAHCVSRRSRCLGPWPRCPLRFNQQIEFGHEHADGEPPLFIRPVAGRKRFSRCVTRALQLIPAVGAMVQELPVQQRVPTMMAHAVCEGRLFWLKTSEWSVLLVSVALCGFLTLLF